MQVVTEDRLMNELLLNCIENPYDRGAPRILADYLEEDCGLIKESRLLRLHSNMLDTCIWPEKFEEQRKRWHKEMVSLLVDHNTQPVRPTMKVHLPKGQVLELVWVPPGVFWMGSPATEANRFPDELLHAVALTEGFWASKYTITQAQWEAVMGSNPSNFKGPMLPVDTVSWDDCQEFNKKLNKYLDAGYEASLLTEAEWEYTCRAGTTTPFFWGENINTDLANYDGNYPYNGGPKGIYRGKTVDVDSFFPSAWGLYQMHGNVWEWCQDYYNDYEEGKDDLDQYVGDTLQPLNYDLLNLV